MTSSPPSAPIITTDLVLLDTEVTGDKHAVIARLADSLAGAGRTNDSAGLTGAAMARARLAGQSSAFIVEQMQAFRSGSRPATVMHQLAKGFSDAQIRALAAYFAAQR